MSNPNLVLERIRQTKQTGKLWAYPGGIHPMENKKQSNQKPIRSLHLPKFFYVPVVQHSGWAGELIINVGDKVLKGQALTKGDNFRQLPVHSPTSGTVLGIAPHVSAHPSGLPEVTVIIETDGKDEWIERQPIDDFLTLTSDQIIQKVYQYGIAGLGGAVFPTASKLSLADKRCKLLIINGAECEPYITCDDRLMQDYTAELIEGIRILRYVLRPEEVVLAIEDNKPKAIKAIQKALKGSDDIHVQPIPTKYPSGASDQLVQILTGLEIPQGKRTIEMGIVMHNVGTAFAVKRAVMDDEPLIERVVTLTGDKIRNKGNVWARLGTPIQHLLEQVDYQADSRFPVFLGGPMTGFILQSLQAPITKTANCIIAPDHFEYAPPEPERSCIRCSSCSDACPVGLLPQQLYWFARSDDHDKSKEYHLEACIECGVCAYVCPSYIPLIQYFRQEKAKIAEIEEKAKKAEEAKIRFEAREARLQKEKEARTARIAQAADKRREEIASSAGEDPVAAALARIKAKKAEAQLAEPVHAKADIKANGEPDNSELMAQRRARRLAKQAEVTNEVNDNLSINTVQQVEETDPKKAAVAAALARARAKKVAQQAPAQAVEMSEKIATATEAEDPRKAAVAAALARAKAKKTAQQTAQQAPQQAVENAEKVAAAIEVEDPRKAAVAAALARAKAKKAAQQAPEQSVENAEKVASAVDAEDPRKAAVAAALARAKAKKVAQQAQEQAVENAEKVATAMEAEDPRKAAVAAALARAKAKKAAQQAAQQVSEQAVENAEKVATATEVEDPRKAAVAAAIARAKAKKMSQGLQND
ncbi:electron transport complex subunit RsxC [Actinobacillus equuli]|uniref:electron transport complex subunit RsxC n=1 Tax=Actinobacillus equuli TaxID=718 RepID=UPI002442F3D4|nr:electron transport complex subunit RsxC [Actinobacillus equuli]WGE51994.1 electron transport complex subunit RsxC [Actinobacillus equuli subsp. haemolyticus]